MPVQAATAGAPPRHHVGAESARVASSRRCWRRRARTAC